MTDLYEQYVLILANAMFRADMDTNPSEYEFARIDLETANYNSNLFAAGDRRPRFDIPEMYIYRARAAADKLIGDGGEKSA